MLYAQHRQSQRNYETVSVLELLRLYLPVAQHFAKQGIHSNKQSKHLLKQ